MKVLLIIIAMLGVAQAQNASIDTTEFLQKKGTHTAKIIFETAQFNARNHKIGHGGDCITIDDRRPLGTDCGLPKVEIASLRFVLDGREIQVPKRLYSDCYMPPSWRKYKAEGVIGNYLQIRFSDDAENVFVFFAGGDGAGSYQVIWVLRRDGKHTRFVNEGSDCSIIDFNCVPN